MDLFACLLVFCQKSGAKRSMDSKKCIEVYISVCTFTNVIPERQIHTAEREEVWDQSGTDLFWLPC